MSPNQKYGSVGREKFLKTFFLFKNTFGRTIKSGRSLEDKQTIFFFWPKFKGTVRWTIGYC